MAGEKTEKATPKKRKDERKKGNVFVSKDAVTAVSLIASFYGLKMFAPTILTSIQDLIKRYISIAGTKESFLISDIATTFLDLAVVFLKCAMPLVLIAVAVAISDRYTNEEAYALKYMAEAMGAKAYRVTKKEEFEPALREAIALNIPVVRPPSDTYNKFSKKVCNG